MEQRRFRLFISSLVALVALQMQAEAQQPLPRLVVCITVDQLRSDYLEELQPIMEQSGLRLMLGRGHYTRHVPLPLYQPNHASVAASLATGTYPSVHGIEAPTVYLRGKSQTQAIYQDVAYQGNYTRDTFSPRALLVGTLGDRIKEASGGSALVYSIAPEAEQALATAGLLADGAYWLDSRIGSWSTTSYYPAMLQALESYNRSSEGPNKRLLSGGVQWRPLRSYTDVPIRFSQRSASFSYRYQPSDVARYKQSALANEEVTNLAVRLIETAGYEHRQAPGLLSLSYTLASQTADELSAEDVDSYVRLDAQLARLFATLEKRIGLSHCLITLSGTGYVHYRPTQRANTDKLQRTISVERLTALTNMYLSATHGAGDWIEANRNGRIYLNRRLIESRKLRLADVQTEVADFLRVADGVSDVLPQHTIHQSTSEVALRLARSINSRYEADVYWLPLPGWGVEEQEANPLLIPTSAAIASPFIIMGAGIDPKTFDYATPREATDIVRVICNILRIRPPND